MLGVAVLVCLAFDAPNGALEVRGAVATATRRGVRRELRAEIRPAIRVRRTRSGNANADTLPAPTDLSRRAILVANAAVAACAVRDSAQRRAIKLGHDARTIGVQRAIGVLHAIVFRRRKSGVHRDGRRWFRLAREEIGTNTKRRPMKIALRRPGKTAKRRIAHLTARARVRGSTGARSATGARALSRVRSSIDRCRLPTTRCGMEGHGTPERTQPPTLPGSDHSLPLFPEPNPRKDPIIVCRRGQHIAE